MSMFGKIVQFLLNDALVKTLANSKTFQRFALKTDAMAKNAKTASADAMGKVEVMAKDKIKEQVSKVQTAKPSDDFNFHAFLKDFTEEISGKDISKPKSKAKIKAKRK